jgi:hypothetical protein
VNPWFLHLEAEMQREGTDEEPLYFHEKTMFDPTAMHLLEQYRQDRTGSREELHRAVSRTVMDLLDRFLNADEAIQRGEITADDTAPE